MIKYSVNYTGVFVVSGWGGGVLALRYSRLTLLSKLLPRSSTSCEGSLTTAYFSACECRVCLSLPARPGLMSSRAYQIFATPPRPVNEANKTGVWLAFPRVFGLISTAPIAHGHSITVYPHAVSTESRYIVLNFFLDWFHKYILLDNIIYFSTWYVFPVLPVHGGHYYS